MNRAILALTLLLYTLSCGCATAAKKSSGPPPGIKLLYEQDEFRIGTQEDRSWYSLDVFNREMSEIHRRFDEAGVPGHVQEQFKEQLKTTYRMRYAMKKEIERRSTSFRYLWLQVKPGVALKIHAGDFRLELEDPTSGARQVVADQGALIWHWDGQDRDFQDSLRSTCLVDSRTQQLKERRPIDVYLRFPPEYHGWALLSVSLSPDGVQVSGP